MNVNLSIDGSCLSENTSMSTLGYYFAGNAVRKASVYLADPQSADHVQRELSEINHLVKENILEAPNL